MLCVNECSLCCVWLQFPMHHQSYQPHPFRNWVLLNCNGVHPLNPRVSSLSITLLLSTLVSLHEEYDDSITFCHLLSWFCAVTSVVTPISYSISQEEQFLTQIRQVGNLSPGTYTVSVSAQTGAGTGPDSALVKVVLTAPPRESHIVCIQPCTLTYHACIRSPN